MRQLRDTEENWSLTDPVLLDGEIAVTIDNNRVKIGDGVSPWSSLSYSGLPAPAEDGKFYGYVNSQPAIGMQYRDYSGDLNDVDAASTTVYRLVDPITNGWFNYRTGMNFLIHMPYGDGDIIQIGYASSTPGTLLPIMQQRRYQSGAWSDWNSNSLYQPSAFVGDLNTLAIGGGWQASAPLGDGVTNGPPDAGIGAIVTHTQNSPEAAVQVVVDPRATGTPRIWVRSWDVSSPTQWTNWNAVGGRDTPMVWQGTWTSRQYARSEVVNDEGWLMVANVDTSERPAPQPLGDATYLYDGASPESTNNAKQIVMGVEYVAPVDGSTRQIDKYRVYTEAGQDYTIYVVLNFGTANERLVNLVQFTGASRGWREVNLGQALYVEEGSVTRFLAVINAADPSPTVTVLNYDYSTPGGPNANDPTPAAGEIVQGTNTPELLSVHKTDQNGDQTATLAAVSLGDIIEGGGIQWTVQSSTDRGDYYTFTVAPALIGTTGVQDFEFESVTAQDIVGVTDSLYFLDADGISGLFGFDAIPESILPDNNAYGVDFEVETVLRSPDWDFMAFTPNSDLTGGSTSGGGGGANITVGEVLPIGAVPGALHYLTVEPVGLYVYYDDGSSQQWVQTNGGGGVACPFPVDSIYMSASPTNPATLWPGTTWGAFAQGRTIVGVGDNGESEWTAGEERGSETHQLTVDEMPAHTHSAIGQVGGTGDDFDGNGKWNRNQTADTTSTGGDQPHNNIQPSIATYMWRRLT
jgi:hypothetical protein